MRSTLHRVLPLLLSTSALLGQSIVVPNALATTRGTGSSNTVFRNSGNPRTAQIGIGAPELAGIPVGSMITGISFRAGVTTSNTALWPPADTTWTSYDVTIGNAIPLGTWTTTFASNFSGTPVQARSGTMVIEANTFQNNSALPAPQVNPWGEFYLDLQKPFLYMGGDLAILLSHPGSNSTVVAEYLEYATAPANMVAYSASTYPATTGAALTTIWVMRIHFGYGSGCPGTGGAVPNLVLTSNVAGGGSATFAGANGLASAPAAFAIGTNQLAVPLPFGCTLLNDAVVVLPATLSTYGRAKISGTFPSGVAGVVCAQMFVLDAGAPFGLAASLGAKLTITP